MIVVFKTEEGAYVLDMPKYVDLMALSEVDDFLDELENAEERMVDWSSVPYKTVDELKEFIEHLTIEDWATLGKIFRFLDDFFVGKIVFYYKAPCEYEKVYLVEDVDYDWKTNKVSFEYEGKIYEFPVVYIDFWLTRRD